MQGEPDAYQHVHQKVIVLRPDEQAAFGIVNEVVVLVQRARIRDQVEDATRVIEGVVTDRDVMPVDERLRMRSERNAERDNAREQPDQRRFQILFTAHVQRSASRPSASSMFSRKALKMTLIPSTTTVLA